MTEPTIFDLEATYDPNAPLPTAIAPPPPPAPQPPPLPLLSKGQRVAVKDPGELTTDPELLEKERELRRQQRERNPWVDCFQCIHHTLIDEATYRCKWLSFPIQTHAPYGTHIGCNRFQEGLHAESTASI